MSLPGRCTSVGFGASERAGWISSDWYFAALIAAVAVYYLFLLSNGTFQLFAPEMLDKAFDNMLVHLLRGEAVVDREAIDFEAFTHDGKTYAYFGVFPALLRLPALPFVDLAQVPLARLSCLTAVVFDVAVQLRMLVIVHQTLPPQNRLRSFLGIMMAATVLSGPQLYILGSASIYHEPILWSAAMAAIFNLVLVRAAFEGGALRLRDLAGLAVLAGLAINTRASIGVALYLGTTLLVAWAAWKRQAGGTSTTIRGLASDPSITLPIAVLLLFAIAVGAVNFARWGNPFSFADFRYYYWGLRHANFLGILQNYGEINLGRMWIGALYYATGIPYLVKGVHPFAEFLDSRMAAIEAPPFSPFLTNPLTIFLAGTGVYHLWWRPSLPPQSAAILRLALIGHSSAVLLILAAMYLTMRYRFDFAPFMTMAALIGYRAISFTAAERRESWRKRLRVAAAGLCVLGVLGSHYVLLIHKVWSIAVPMPVRLALLPFAPFARAAFEP
ncbi:MAG TPA: hypothetical protein VHT52_06435 [Stellaceae bacterium]|nr:hypothetical protein [Stellaceae bacterium]